MVEAVEKIVPRPAAEYADGERDRLVGLLEQYRRLVSRAADGGPLGPADEQVVPELLASLWLVEGCWRRDVAAWRDMDVVRACLDQVGASAAPGVRHRQRELEVLHPHLFLGLHEAAYVRWNTTRRAWR